MCRIAGVYFSQDKAPNPGLEGTMKIDGTTFGSITIDGKTYDHDVIVRLSEKVEKRKKKLSKRVYGSSHTVSEDEAKFVFEKGCKRLIFGTGQDGNASLSPQAAAYLEKQGCKVHCRADSGCDSDLQQIEEGEGRPFPRNMLISRKLLTTAFWASPVSVMPF